MIKSLSVDIPQAITFADGPRVGIFLFFWPFSYLHTWDENLPISSDNQMGWEFIHLPTRDWRDFGSSLTLHRFWTIKSFTLCLTFFSDSKYRTDSTDKNLWEFYPRRSIWSKDKLPVYWVLNLFILKLFSYSLDNFHKSALFSGFLQYLILRVEYVYSFCRLSQKIQGQSLKI